ncbi:MAG: 2-C-methyl-D-erythritol 4-phosphate cytidylyltransferase, partial [Oscillospiraceae bacterium]|nr:2-C-methyl-D-erythritol 4-phosphate cytidylyltransferase [Oscillospiraceae bacterium]
KIIEGGQTRTESVFNGVLAASKKARIIAIHDGARICVDNGVISRGIAAVSKYPAAAPGIPVSSTIKRVVKGIVQETVDREDLFEIQTPQVFKAEVIKVALTKTLKETDSITDDCIAVERMGLPVHIFEGSRSNIKLTTLEDILIAETILQTQGNRPMVFE